jgi:hypothetical protein
VPLGAAEPCGRKSQTHAPQGILQEHRHGGERQDHRKAAGDQLIHHAGRPMIEPKPEEDGGGGRNTADGKPPDDAPIDSPAEAERGGSDEFRAGGKHQIGADGDGGRLSEDEHQDRRHQRAATHAGEAHECADNQAAEDIEQGIGHRRVSVPGCRGRS